MAGTTTQGRARRSRRTRPSGSTTTSSAPRPPPTRFRAIDDQARVDRIVHALVVAGLEHAVELAAPGDGGDRLRRVRGQGGQELHRHRVPLRLPQGQALGRGDRGGRRARGLLRRRADRRRARAHADHQPDLDGAVQGDRRGQDPQRDDLPPVGARGALRAANRSSSSRRPARPPACPPTRCRSIPDPTLDVSQYLFHHPGVDFIWTTGGPKAVAAANAAGKPCLSVGAGNAPVYVHRSADVGMAVVDMLISKTFDSSVICPAEQTCIVDEPVWDEMRRRAPAPRRAAARRGRGGGAERRRPSTTAPSSSRPSASRA